MFPDEINKNPIWCLYDNLSGITILKHPWQTGLKVNCPHCNKLLNFEKYKASCCGFNFGISFNEVHQKEPVGTHDKTSGRGWESIRPYIK
ncbi:MAG: hypothetical protein ISS16_12310 [Ignavibacteria bacterium]|nr:hypothetical protein [Ignavibacteria bacterium]